MPASAAAASAARSLLSRCWRASIPDDVTSFAAGSFTMSDLLVKGTLYTLDPGGPVAEAALIRDGRFARVGSREECDREARDDVRYIDLEEGCAVPGLIDAHGHPLLHARSLIEVRLDGARSEQECVERIARYAATVPEGGWIRGSGWDQNLWPGRAFPRATLLEAATQ